MNRLVIPGISEEDTAVLFNVKDLKQYTLTVENLLQGRCPFCQIDPSLNKILFQNDSWFLWESAFPQSNQSCHLVIPHRNHIGHIRDLVLKDFLDFSDVLDWVDKNFDIPGGGMTLRFGDARLHAGSVPNHLHWNIQVPNGNGRVQVTLCKDQDDHERKLKVLLVFEKLRTGTAFDSLSDEEQKIVAGRI